MKVFDAVYKTLMGDGIVTGRDENGLFVHYDKITVSPDTGEMLLSYKGTLVATEMINPLQPGNRLIIGPIEGRLRIAVGEVKQQ